MRFKFPTCFAFFIVLGSTIGGSPTGNVQSVPQEIQEIVAKLQSLSSFKADIDLVQGEGEVLNGVLSYQKGKFHFILSDGRVVASNGIYMMAYSPVENVAGKQKVEPEMTGGPNWLLRGFDYEVSFLSRSAIGRVKKGTHSSIEELRLSWEEDYTLRQLSILYKDATQFDLRFSNISSRTSFSASIFSYRPPTGSRTVENVLDRKK